MMMATPSRLRRRQVVIVDSCILIELVQVPFESDHHADRAKRFQDYVNAGAELRIPVACVLETGRHVQMISEGQARRDCAQRLDRFIRAAVDGSKPWKFSALEWNSEFVSALLDGPYDGLVMWESLAKKYLEMGDMAILTEFRRLHSNLDARAVELVIWTDDEGLRGAVDQFLADSTGRPSK